MHTFKKKQAFLEARSIRCEALLSENQGSFLEVFWESSGKHKNSKISMHQNGVDCNTKKCSFYRGQCQILTLGFFSGAVLKLTNNFLGRLL